MTPPVLGGGSKPFVFSRISVVLALVFVLASALPVEMRASGFFEADSDTIHIHKTLKLSICIDPSNGSVGYAPVVTAENAAVNGNEKKAAAKPSGDTVGFDIKPVLALRTNLLLPLMNVGVQVPLGNRFSLGLDWYYPFIYRNWSPHLDQTNCFQALAPGVDFRIYLGKRHSKGRENWQYRLSGHSIGIYGMVGRYDVEWQFHGEQARFLNAGIDYMYSARIGKRKRMRLDLSLGVGYFRSSAVEYQVFSPGGLAYKTGKTLEHTWIGPNKATVSLVIPINKKVKGRSADE